MAVYHPVLLLMNWDLHGYVLVVDSEKKHLKRCFKLQMVAVNKKRPPEFLLKVSEGWRLPTLPLGIAVPSALTGLTSLFGMGRGGSPSLLPPLSISFVLASARTGRCGGPTVYDGERKNFSIFCFVYLFSTRSTTEVSGY